jgi:hypothetical protein
MPPHMRKLIFDTGASHSATHLHVRNNRALDMRTAHQVRTDLGGSVPGLAGKHMSSASS